MRDRSVFAYEALVRGRDGSGAASILQQVNEHNRYVFDQSCRVKAVELAARLAAVQVAEAQADSQRAGHYPTLSLTTQLTRRETRQYQELDPRQDTYYVGVQLDIPLYRGGAVRASVAKAEAVDPMTLRITTKEVAPNLLVNLAQLPIMSKKAASGAAAPRLAHRCGGRL